MTTPRKRIAVVGGGVAGIGAAWYLQGDHDVTLFEAADRLGGHANPVQVMDPAGPVMVDTGFLVFNTQTYPLFFAFLEELDLMDRVIPADMALSYYDHERNLRFATPDLGGVFYQRRNLVSLRFYKMFLDLFRFRRRGREDLRAGRLGRATLGEYTARYSRLLREDIIEPVGAAIWSVPGAQVMDFPAASFLRFFDNHRMLEGIPEKLWRTLHGSSSQYLTRFTDRFQGTLRLSTPVSSVSRHADGVRLTLPTGDETYDAVVLGTHADVSLKLLADPTPDESRLLGAWRYHSNPSALHTDASVMPPDRRMWRSWNIRITPAGTQVTYWLNTVQSLPVQGDYFLSLDADTVAPEHVLGRFDYRHPVFDFESLDTQARLPELGGDRTWFCGSYHGFGFHEDALRSARAAADGLS